MSEWQERANKRRDERHTKVEATPVWRRRKANKRRWCKGRKGVEHTPVWQKRKPFLMPISGEDLHKNHREFVCTTCKKVLEIWWGRRGLWRSEARSKPRIGSTKLDGT